MKTTALIVISCFVFSLAENSPPLRRIKRTSSLAAHNETNLTDLKLINDPDFHPTSPRSSCKRENSRSEKEEARVKKSVIGNIIAIKNQKIAALKNSAADQNDQNVDRTQTVDKVKINQDDFNNKITSMPDSLSMPFIEPVKRKKNVITYIFGAPEMEVGGTTIQSSETLPFPFTFAEMGEHDKDRSPSAERKMIYKFSNHDETRENNNSTMHLTKSNNNNNDNNNNDVNNNKNSNRNLLPETYREDFIGRNRIDANFKDDTTLTNSIDNNTKSNNTNNSGANHIESPYNKHKEDHPVFMSNFAYVTRDNGINAHHKTAKDDNRKIHHYDSTTLKQKSDFVSGLRDSENFNKTDRVTSVSLMKSQQRPLQSQVRIQLSESSPMVFPKVISSPLDGFLKIAHWLVSGLGHNDGSTPFHSHETQFFVNPVNTFEPDDTDSTDYLYNNNYLDGSQAAAGVRSGISPLNTSPALSLPLPLLPPLVLQSSHYITSGDHYESQPLNFIENAIDTVLNGKRVGGVGVGGISATAISGLAGTNEIGDGEDDFELRCPVHHEESKRNGNTNHLIQVCSCHLYKKKKTA